MITNLQLPFSTNSKICSAAFQLAETSIENPLRKVNVNAKIKVKTNFQIPRNIYFKNKSNIFNEIKVPKCMFNTLQTVPTHFDKNFLIYQNFDDDKDKNAKRQVRNTRLG